LEFFPASNFIQSGKEAVDPFGRLLALNCRLLAVVVGTLGDVIRERSEKPLIKAAEGPALRSG
jgi:hypothetical protein